MSWGPFEHLNIYLPYGLRKLGFKNTIGNRPLLSPIFFIMDGWWMDGWMESFFLFFFLHIYTVYSSGIDVYLKVSNFVQNKILMGFKIWSSWGLGYTNSKFTIGTTIFVFSSKT